MFGRSYWSKTQTKRQRNLWPYIDGWGNSERRTRENICLGFDGRYMVVWLYTYAQQTAKTVGAE